MELAECVAEGEVLTMLKDVNKLAVVPLAQPVECGEGEVRNCATLAADEFASAAHVVLHPCGEQ